MAGPPERQTILWTIVLATAVLARSLEGQNPRWWVGAGIGVAAGRMGCDICSADRDLGPAAQITAGYALNRRLGFGIEAAGWTSNDAELGVRDMILDVAGLLYWYPNPASARFHLKAGIGRVFYRAQDSDVAVDETGEPAITSSALGIHLGVGYDVPFGALTVTPFFSLSDMLVGSALRQQDIRLADVRVSLIQLGLGVTWRP